MQRFTAFDLQRNVGPVQDAAMQAPVAITHHGRDRLVLMSASEFARLKRRDKQVIAIEEMPEEFIAALREPVDDPELAALDHLLDD
ncbi:MAG TPA: type II toxin-antitoxin system prevent-host-death family antitoxin [Azospirillum sp.]|nr:type II toxin-antitoxin system prevent-host-death family antitoxin [Azospirillum sp.]